MNYICVNSGKATKVDTLKVQTSSKKEVSVIIPTYNEKENISELIQEIQKTLSKTSHEIIIVDDNSSDGTGEIIDKYAKSESVVALHRLNAKNILSALQDGAKIARGKNIVIMDADFSHPPSEIPIMLKHLPEFDLVVADRLVKGGGLEGPLRRRIGTRGLNWFCRAVLGIREAKDLTGGFNAIKREKFRQIEFRYKSRWGEFDIELIYRAIKNGCKVKIVPFTYKYRTMGTSKSRDYRYSKGYLMAALRLRFSKNRN